VYIIQITIEKTVLQQNYSYYELQGEYVLPGTRDRNSVDREGGLMKRLMSGHIGNAISSMGRWRMKLEVPRAEVAEMLPLARLLSRSLDPAVRSRSKVVSLSLFMPWGVTYIHYQPSEYSILICFANALILTTSRNVYHISRLSECLGFLIV